MVVEYTKTFVKDLEAINNKELALSVKNVIEHAKSVNSVAELKSIKKMKGAKNAYRIRAGSYRIGFYMEKNTILFARFLHRKDIYKYFPQ
jgi:mRNA interferase RelE/StbE